MRFHVPAAQVEFVGALGEGLRTLRDRWSRESQPDAHVTFERDSTVPTVRVRTQFPITPKGYRAEEVSFVNPRDRRVTLAGTVSVPDGPGPIDVSVA